MRSETLPPGVVEACQRAAAAGFTLACEAGVGRLLAVLAAATQARGRILEMGTGVGVGTAWIVDGLADRRDVEVISVEMDPATAAIAARGHWPDCISLRVGDVLGLLSELGSFDLIFADAQGGKWEGLDRTIQALRPGGILLVDDMTPPTWLNEAHRRKTADVRRTLLTHPALVAAELAEASGMILATRRR